MAENRTEHAGIRREIARRLALGSLGTGHLAGVARMCFEAAPSDPDGRELLRLGFDAALAAWEADPLHPLLPGYLLSLDKPLDMLSPDVRRALSLLSTLAAPPGEEKYLDRLKASGDAEKLAGYLRRSLNKAPRELFRVREYCALARTVGDFSGCRDLLARPFPEPLEPIRERLRADMDLALDRPDDALGRYDAASPLFSAAFHENARALCLRAMGETDKAAGAFSRALSARPWLTNSLLSLYDMVFGVSQATAPLPGPAAALFYAFDKPEPLDRALAAVYEADPRPDLVIALDNGSRAPVGGVIAAWADRFGPERFESIRTPVNIGAPAARNWLISRMAQLGAARFPVTVFLDDDAYVPKDFLTRFGAAMAAYPDAGVWGCKTVSANAPRIVQHADIHLLPPALTEEADLVPGTASFGLYRPQEESPDLGLFDYMRPCASVTGCCHAFRTQTLLSMGGFDPQFSPSQCDDLDHDLMLAERGLYAVYQGRLTVRHDKSSGLGQGLSASAVGNIHKLYRKRSRSVMERLRLHLSDIASKDLEAKRARLADESLL